MNNGLKQPKITLEEKRENILKIVEPLITKEPTKAVVDVPEVRTLIGKTTICWGCLSLTCRTRQLLSQRLMDKKLVNKFCPVRKDLLGDRNLSRNLKGKVEKDNY